MTTTNRRAQIVPVQIILASLIILAWTALGHAASWTPLSSLAPDYTGTMLLLTDGTVMVQGYSPANNWMQLTPDSSGSYINGTWSRLASMSIPRLYYASHVLPTGRVWILGGEYSGFGLSQNFTNTGEIYDAVTNTWAPIANHPESQFGDVPSMLLSEREILAGSLFTNRTYLYDIAMNSWSFAAAKVYNDRSDEEGWVKLPDGSVLTYDIFQSVITGGSYAERYDTATGEWSSISPSDGTARGIIPQLSGTALGFELGPLVRVRLRDGRVFLIGATGHTALYTASTNTWRAGPDIVGVLPSGPALFGADDAPAAVTPNGHVLFAADAGPSAQTFQPPTQIFDFDPGTNTISPVAPPIPADLSIVSAYVTRMLMLPTGEVLFSDSSSQLWVYTPDGSPKPKARPVINKIRYDGGGVFTLTGRRLNGQSAGSAYGDDVESDENYPIVRFTDTAGTVFYGRTTNWSNTGVGTGSAHETVNFTLHPAMTPGTYAIEVIGAGTSSSPVDIEITSRQASLSR